jgi:excisionase family DNA binding protein
VKFAEMSVGQLPSGQFEATNPVCETGSTLKSAKLKVLQQPALTKQEVADLLRIGLPTVDSYIHKGWLRAIKLSPRCSRILVEDFQRFLASRANIEPEGTIPA